MVSRKTGGPTHDWPIARASRSQSEYGFVHIKGTAIVYLSTVLGTYLCRSEKVWENPLDDGAPVRRLATQVQFIQEGNDFTARQQPMEKRRRLELYSSVKFSLVPNNNMRFCRSLLIYYRVLRKIPCRPGSPSVNRKQVNQFSRDSTPPPNPLPLTYTHTPKAGKFSAVLTPGQTWANPFISTLRSVDPQLADTPNPSPPPHPEKIHIVTSRKQRVFLNCARRGALNQVLAEQETSGLASRVPLFEHESSLLSLVVERAGFFQPLHEITGSPLVIKETPQWREPTCGRVGRRVTVVETHVRAGIGSGVSPANDRLHVTRVRGEDGCGGWVGGRCFFHRRLGKPITDARPLRAPDAAGSSLFPNFQGAAVAEWLACFSPTKANRVQSPARSFPELSQVGIVLDDAAVRRVFSGISRFPRPCFLALLLSHLISPHIGSQDLFVKSRANLSTTQGRNSFNDLQDRLYSTVVMYKYADINCTLVVCCHSGKRQLVPRFPGGVKHRVDQRLKFYVFCDAAMHALFRPGSCLERTWQSITPGELLQTRWSGAEIQGRGKRKCPEKTHRQAASSSTMPTCENPGPNPSGIDPGSPRWEASALATAPPLSLTSDKAHTIMVLSIYKPGNLADSFGHKQYSTILCAFGHQLVVNWLLLQFNPRPGSKPRGCPPCDTSPTESYPDVADYCTIGSSAVNFSREKTREHDFLRFLEIRVLPQGNVRRNSYFPSNLLIQIGAVIPGGSRQLTSDCGSLMTLKLHVAGARQPDKREGQGRGETEAEGETKALTKGDRRRKKKKEKEKEISRLLKARKIITESSIKLVLSQHSRSTEQVNDIWRRASLHPGEGEAIFQLQRVGQRFFIGS
ncbi:hypothetical protein PR048_022231 [Dryococelus australis]|uniref:Uncharacterized protein n=1 Tax=Dryococelus australis TaxID=614101 RepID=A0ABQ9H0H5_9NEOP|nr:hypothetical protein PR048_022231 [Dryococelus australis]